MTDDNSSILERKSPPKSNEGQIDEFVYIPLTGDPAHTTVGAAGVNADGSMEGGYAFIANIPQKLARKSTTVQVLVRQERELPDGQIVSRSIDSRPASLIRRTRSCRRSPCGVVAPASW